MLRFLIVTLIWLFTGVLVAAEAVAVRPPRYDLIVGYGLLYFVWAVGYAIRARSGMDRRWWLGGAPELVMILRDRRRVRTGGR